MHFLIYLVICSGVWACAKGQSYNQIVPLNPATPMLICTGRRAGYYSDLVTDAAPYALGMFYYCDGSTAALPTRQFQCNRIPVTNAAGVITMEVAFFDNDLKYCRRRGAFCPAA